MLGRNKGITLIALVITIIILLILAGVTLSLVSGENGILKKATDAAGINDKKTAEEELELVISEIKIKYYEDYNENAGKSLGDYIIENLDGYETSNGKITCDGKKVNYVSSNGTVTGTINEKGELEINKKGIILSSGKLNLEIKEGLEPPIAKITANLQNITGEIIWTNTAPDIATVEVNGETATVKGLAVGKTKIIAKCGEYTANCEVIVSKKSTVVKPTVDDIQKANADTTKFTTDYGTIDIVWLNTNNEIISKPEEPQLFSGESKLKPVTWTFSGDTWNEDNEQETARKVSEGNWYNYKMGNGREDNVMSQWANGKNVDGSYFVWIPRFAYKITYYSSKESMEPTGYYDGSGMWTIDESGEVKVKFKLDEGIQTVSTEDGLYIVHPAFEINLDNGGWDKQLAGFWTAKYEMSKSNLKYVSLPNVTSTRSISVGNIYTYSKNYDRDKESHLMKNSEWGAIAYLTQSTFGRNGNEIAINTNGYKTGGGSYQTINGAKQSTTGNIYGIYDMSGAAWEFIAGFNKWGKSDCIEGEKYALQMTQEAKEGDGKYKSTKYITVYENQTTLEVGNSVVYTVGKVGDATKEVNKGGKDESTSKTQYSNWFSDKPSIIANANPIIARGNISRNGSAAGIFASTTWTGAAYSYIGFRTVLCP